MKRFLLENRKLLHLESILSVYYGSFLNSVFRNKDVFNFIRFQLLLLLICSLLEVSISCICYYDNFFWDLRNRLMTRGVE